ncbi:MAG TPA: hypothetical protein VE441_01805 [Mycobacterium sp.]|jgi:hypothetical protein|nr:hypothetical protein [Mycobacterium sp.]
MNDTVPLTPPGFTEVPDDAFRDAHAAAWAAVNDPAAVDRMRRYYGWDGWRRDRCSPGPSN